ncbi:Retrovirus-related Pol polyprotein from type-1 retrotransposable element R1 [Araneus ventricosus]|uniref:Retrovirus-related Pol polyprotein from type-1 retrotransposable element R1 n=1 Tax=Araneus ventricosus TaxID=182803 RepID=A0A4Y2V2U0_ARAVE|nr:Retrovirus-related Pol polyprotein from type-1 retrotransposable element R1 [Araneus ventricosus]
MQQPRVLQGYDPSLEVLRALKDLECPANIFKLVSSFLDDRQVFINYDGCRTIKNYSVGCPQRSNSGPLYRLLIANETLNLQFEEGVRLLACADDLYLFIKATGKHTIQERATRGLEQLDLWGKGVKISFAHQKTKHIQFGKKGKYKHPPYCRFAGNPIKLERRMKMLGVILDDGLNGMPHINYVRDKVQNILNRLTIAKHQRGLSGKVVKLLYKRALERILVYAAPAWWTGTARQIQRVSIQHPASNASDHFRGIQDNIHKSSANLLRYGAHRSGSRHGGGLVQDQQAKRGCLTLWKCD